jgi:hypothetical protein
MGAKNRESVQGLFAVAKLNSFIFSRLVLHSFWSDKLPEVLRNEENTGIYEGLGDA